MRRAPFPRLTGNADLTKGLTNPSPHTLTLGISWNQNVCGEWMAGAEPLCHPEAAHRTGTLSFASQRWLCQPSGPNPSVPTDTDDPSFYLQPGNQEHTGFRPGRSTASGHVNSPHPHPDISTVFGFHTQTRGGDSALRLKRRSNGSHPGTAGSQIGNWKSQHLARCLTATTFVSGTENKNGTGSSVGNQHPRKGEKWGSTTVALPRPVRAGGTRGSRDGSPEILRSQSVL